MSNNIFNSTFNIMKTVTYSLKLDNTNSEEYYKDIRSLADEIMEEAEKEIVPVVSNYIKYLTTFNLEEVRAKEEYVLELLSFGILWRTYAHIAVSVKYAPFFALIHLGEWRKKHRRVKPAIDLLRGVLISLFLLPAKLKKNYFAGPKLEDVDKVCTWFEATSEFREHALRFIRWRAYWGTLSPERLQQIFSVIARFTSWFEKRSIEKIGKYTENVEGFIQENRRFYSWREDRISCSRSRLEYHLNMAGAELMNRAFKAGFNSTDLTAVLLPGCMRAFPEKECKAKKEEKGLICTGCTPNCRVNSLRMEGQMEGYEVYIIPHASDLSLWSPKRGEPVKGVIASACVTTLVEGGLELKRYGVPAQCVLLDYSGCKKHWHETGVPTSLNRNELKRIFERDSNYVV